MSRPKATPMPAKLIAIVAPPAPRCFETRMQWTEYLTSCQQAAGGGGRTSNARRPFIDGKYDPSFPICRDCSAQHSFRMVNLGKCDWPAWVRSITPVTDTEKEGANT